MLLNSSYTYLELRWVNRLGIKCGLRTCGLADRYRYNMRTKNADRAGPHFIPTASTANGEKTYALK